MDFVELHFAGTAGSEVTVNLAHVKYVHWNPSHKYTEVYFFDGRSLNIRETPKEIMRQGSVRLLPH